MIDPAAVVDELEPKPERKPIPFDPGVGDERYPLGSYDFTDAIGRAVHRTHERNAKQRLTLIRTPLRGRAMFLIQDVR